MKPKPAVRTKSPELSYEQTSEPDQEQVDKLYDWIFEQVQQQYIDNDKVLHL